MRGGVFTVRRSVEKYTVSVCERRITKYGRRQFLMRLLYLARPFEARVRIHTVDIFMILFPLSNRILIYDR